MELLISDNSGETSVFLDHDGDHIVVRLLTDSAGYQREISLPFGSFAYDRAVGRAQRGAAFLMTSPHVQSAANTLGNWRARRTAYGKAPSDDDLRREAMARWPDLTGEQIAEAVALCIQKRDSQ